jgi:D-lactate dehydrogenase
MQHPTCLVFNLDAAETPSLTAWAAQHPHIHLSLQTQRLSAETLATYVAQHPQHRVEALSFCTAQPINQALLAALPNLRLVLTRSTGYNHIDRAYLASRGIALCNLRNYSTQAVAEHTLWLMLSLAKHGVAQMALHQQLRQPPHHLQRPNRVLGLELAGATLGVIGLGATGQATLALAKTLGMRLLATSPTPRPADWLAERGIEQVALPTLLAKSNIISLHCPLNPHTEGLINASTLAQCKPSAMLINTARGGLVDSAALLHALNHNQLAAAALDVLPTEATLFTKPEHRPLWATTTTPETLPPHEQALRQAFDSDIALLQHPKVMHTPHTAFYTHTAVVAGVEQTLTSLTAWVTHPTEQPLPYQVLGDAP